MAFDVTGLVAYIEENKADIITKVILGSKILDHIDVRNGIKGTEKIPILESTAPAQTGSACGYTSSGSTTLTQTSISTTSLKVEESLCLKDLEGYFSQKYLPNGSKYTDQLQILQQIIDRKVANIAQKFGQMLVQGDTDYGNDTWLKRMNGFISTVDSASDEIAATQQADITTSTVRGIFEDIIFAKIPARILNMSPLVYCGQDTFRILLNKLWVDNLYHYIPSAADNNAMSLVYPGSNITVVAFPEFNADNGTDAGGSLPTAVQDRILATYKENFVVGLDLESDLKDFEVWYSPDNEQLRMRWRMRAGVAVHFTDLVVSYLNS